MTTKQLVREIETLEARKQQLMRWQRLRTEVAALEIGHLNSKSEAQTIQAVIHTVCEQCRVSVDALMGRCREAIVVEPRHITYYLLRSLGQGMPSTRIGRALGKDHSTVLHACKAVQNRMDTDPRFRALVESLREKCAQALNNRERKHEHQS